MKHVELGAWAACAGAMLSALAAGCDPYTGMEFTLQTATPDGAVIDDRGIELQVGRAVAFVAVPMDGDETMDDVPVRLTSRDDGVAGLGPSLEHRSFVLWGVAPGKTSIQVIVDDEFEPEIPVTIVEEP